MLRYANFALCLVIGIAGGFSPLAAAKPNFVVIVVDDLGVMDIGAYNPHSFYETPHIDRLASQGVRFTDAYAANPVCSPTRYSMMTGKYPTRVAATNWFSGEREGRFRPARLNGHMPLDEMTLGQALQSRGYRTAYVGKWHLGPTAEYWPENRGFELNAGGHNAGSPPGGYFSPYKNPRLSSGPEGEYLTTRLGAEAAAAIERFAGDPFLVYLAPYSVHTPLQAPPELIRKYEAKAARLGLAGVNVFAEEEQVWPDAGPRKVRVVQNHATYAAMVETMDAAVGQVLTKLDELGLDDETIVCLTSDNGGLSTAEGLPTSNLPFRGGKGWLYEGGIREPLIVRWSGVAESGSTLDVPVVNMDLYPTILEAAGVPAAKDQIIDGVSLVPLLRDGSPPDRESLFWHYPHYSNQGGFPGGAVRVDDWKLIERYEDGRVHLYNLREDPGEALDIAAENPERVADLRDRLHRWYADVDAQFLRAKPDGPEPWRP